MAKSPATKVSEVLPDEDPSDSPSVEFNPATAGPGQVADYEVDDLTGEPIGAASDTAIEVYEPDSGSVSLSIGAYSSAPEMESGDIELLRLRLLQGLSTEVQEGTGKPGQWAVTGHPPIDEVTFVPMMYAKRREMRTPDEDRTMVCSSEDGRTGVGTPGGTCKTCPFSQWTKNLKADKNDPPACTPIHSYLGFSTDHGEIVQINLSRTSEAAAKLLNFAAISRKMGNFAVKLRSQANKSNRGSFYTPVIAVVPSVDKSVLSLAKAAFSLE